MNLIYILLACALIAVAASLALGLIAMARGGEFARKYSNRFMQARVILQGIALILFLLAILASR